MVIRARARYAGEVAPGAPMSFAAETPADADPVWPSPGSWVRDLVQTHADDVVIAAALCKANAPGSHELASFDALGRRQLLKARGAYLAETVALGVTPLHVHAIGLFLCRRVARVVGSWRRDELYASFVDALDNRADSSWPALLLTDACGTPRAELQVLQRDDDAWNLLALVAQRRVPRPR